MQTVVSKPQVDPLHYHRTTYDCKWRFISYWYQIDEIVRQHPRTILEVGIGNGFVSKYLRERGYEVTTLDHDPRLYPDVTASTLDLPFKDKSFETVACFEVLEHLPFDSVTYAVSELRRVSQRNVLVSVPDVNRAYRFQITVPKLGEFRALISPPYISPLRHQFDGEHYWEIGKAGYTTERIASELSRAGLTIVHTFRPFECPYHRFFSMHRN
jgi:SAM-dependent methyltransferase